MTAVKKYRHHKQKRNMIKSMTGFGKGTEKSPYGNITVEIKTLNHRSLDIICNPFNGIFLLEQKVQKTFNNKIFRGKVFVRIVMEETPGQGKGLQKIAVNEALAREGLQKIKAVQRKLKIKGEIQIRDIIELPGVIESSAARKKEKGLWPYVEKALEKALGKLLAYREREGMRLAGDFNERLRKIGTCMLEIKKWGKQSVNAHRTKLVQSIQDLADNVEPDTAKLETEVALFARNCDVAEEVTRLGGHIDEYRAAINSVKADTGKKLDFIAQEMQREANTIGAKSSDFRVARAVIEIKSQIEKIREQVRNVE